MSWARYAALAFGGRTPQPGDEERLAEWFQFIAECRQQDDEAGDLAERVDAYTEVFDK
jgi:hypothetical protein